MPSPDKLSSKKVAANLFILQGDAEPLSSALVWAEPSQMLIGIWKFPAGAHSNQLREAGISWPVPMTETGRGSLFPKCQIPVCQFGRQLQQR
jgi:hypothetical protein